MNGLQTAVDFDSIFDMGAVCYSMRGDKNVLFSVYISEAGKAVPRFVGVAGFAAQDFSIGKGSAVFAAEECASECYAF